MTSDPEIKQSKTKRGGRRPGAGRKLGAATQRTREIADAAAKDGKALPLDVMLFNMRRFHDLANEQMSDTGSRKEEREFRELSETSAKDAAPFMHPRLAQVEFKGELAVSHESALDQLR